MYMTVMVLGALAACVLGLCLRVSNWRRFSLNTCPGDSSLERLARSIKRALRQNFSRRLILLGKVFLLDIVLQRTIYRSDRGRWLTHLCLSVGFTGLVIMHALGRYVTAKFLPGYSPNLNPFLFFRDFLGFMVMVGLVLVIHRRFTQRGRRPITNRTDTLAIGILSGILLSGILLEAVKITSYSAFDEMTQEYLIHSNDEDLKALEAFWVEHQGIVSPHGQGPYDPGLVEMGRSFHAMSCAQCHSDSQWAFAGYGAGQLLKSAAVALDRWDARDVLWYVHILVSLLGLAYLPYGKMFHIVSTPLSLMAGAVMGGWRADPVALNLMQALELDACTHCGACTERCSLAVVYTEIHNENILPSEKIGSIRALAYGGVLSSQETIRLRQGLHLCTGCSRCSSACPSGIDLQGLWFSACERLLRHPEPEYLLLLPLAFGRGLMRDSLDGEHYAQPVERALASLCELPQAKVREDHSMILHPGGEISNLFDLSGGTRPGTCGNCYRCMSCTLSCPVVLNYEDAEKELGLLPHQIMHAVGMRLWDLVFGSKMLVNCLGCYKCQEACPECVPVADILCELKNRAISRAMQVDGPSGVEGRLA